MTPVIAGIIVGIIYGSLVGFIKYTVLWKNISKSDKKITTGAMYLRMGISYAINVVMLLFVFLTRNIMPFDFMATIIASAVALSLMGKLSPIKDIVNHVEVVQEENIQEKANQEDKQEEQENL